MFKSMHKKKKNVIHMSASDPLFGNQTIQLTLELQYLFCALWQSFLLCPNMTHGLSCAQRLDPKYINTVPSDNCPDVLGQMFLLN